MKNLEISTMELEPLTEEMMATVEGGTISLSLSQVVDLLVDGFKLLA